MTRKEIEETYAIRNRRITTPGMFEGELIYVPYFWDAYMNGLADSDNGDMLRFNVTAEDKAEFPELKRRRVVSLRQTDQGFITEV